MSMNAVRLHPIYPVLWVVSYVYDKCHRITVRILSATRNLCPEEYIKRCSDGDIEYIVQHTEYITRNFGDSHWDGVVYEGMDIGFKSNHIALCEEIIKHTESAGIVYDKPALALRLWKTCSSQPTYEQQSFLDELSKHQCTTDGYMETEKYVPSATFVPPTC